MKFDLILLDMEASKMSQRERHKTSHEFYFVPFSLDMSLNSVHWTKIINRNKAVHVSGHFSFP